MAEQRETVTNRRSQRRQAPSEKLTVSEVESNRPAKNIKSIREKDVPVRIRSGPGTNYTHVNGEYLGKGTFEIDIVKNGMGSKSGWGHLVNGKGWIALDFVEILN